MPREGGCRGGNVLRQHGSSYSNTEHDHGVEFDPETLQQFEKLTRGELPRGSWIKSNKE